MEGTEFIIKIDIIYFLGIMGSLIVIAWYSGSKFSSLETSINWMKKQIDDIWDTIKGREGGRKQFEASGSPLNPTELGWKHLRGSGLDKLIDVEKREWLLQNLRNSLGPNYTEYDVQETAIRMMFSLRDDSMMTSAKKYAFENGFDFDLLLRLGGFLLRDNFLGRPHEIAPMPRKNE